jgi:hypothetical protein
MRTQAQSGEREMSHRTRRRRHRRHRAGFFIIVGWRMIAVRDGKPPVRATCPQCREEADFVGLLRRRWFTIFFLPILPLDPIDDAQRICRCGACRTTFDRPLEQIARRGGAAASGGGSDWSHSIALYNKLRDNPSDGGVMLQLLHTYEAMNEPGEAAAAARHFPKAFEADPRCRAVLDRMRV